MFNNIRAKKFAGVFVIMLLALMLSACGGVNQHIRPDADLPDFSNDKILIMPASIWGLPGDNLKQQAALFGGFVAAFGKQGVSLQPIQPVLQKAGLGNLSYRMTRGMYHMATFHKTYDFRKDASYHGGNSELPIIIDSTAKLIKLASKHLKLKFKPKYVAVVSVDGWRKWFGKALKLRVTAGIYNTQTGMVEKVVIQNKTMYNSETAVLAELATLGEKIKAILQEKPKAE